MRIADLFETKIEEKIDPVIKVGDTLDEHRLANEIGSYVVTPLIERYLDDFLEHYTDTFRSPTEEIGVWISGYFGSGKSHLAKVMALLIENRRLLGVSASERFAPRVPPDSGRRSSLLRSLARVPQCDTTVLAFNLNTLQDSRNSPLPRLLLSQYYQSRGYSSNFIYARVIESELDRRGALQQLHTAVERRTGKSWAEIQRNLTFYSKHLFAAACEAAPDAFSEPGDVERALVAADQGELYNVSFLVRTLLDDLERCTAERKRPQRVLLVLDESGQWIENDTGRLNQLTALIEEAGLKGQGRLWLVVTTHGDMGSVFKEARALDADMKRSEGRFRLKCPLTTENIELVIEDRLFRKTLPGTQELNELYAERGSVVRGMAELQNTNQTLPPCTEEKFPVYYPFLPYQVHLAPEIVKSLRSKGGRGEQLSGSTRTLLAITQDILRAGRRPYLDEAVGALVSFDEFYANLAAEGEVSPDVRTEISRILSSVPGATALTPRVAEVLYLVRELSFIPRSRDNIARLLVESADDDLAAVLARVTPELERLEAAKLVARIGDEYEFLTGERRTFEEAVATVEQQLKAQDRERGFAKFFVHWPGAVPWREWLGSDTVSYHALEFPFKLYVDGTLVPGKQSDVALKILSPLAAHSSTALSDTENDSLKPDEQYSVFCVSGRVSGFDRDLARFLAMEEVVRNWQGDVRLSEEALKLARDRETQDLPKLRGKVLEGIREGIRTSHVVFRGAERTLLVKPGQTPGECLRSDMAAFWPVLYPKFDRVPVRIANDQRAIQDVLAGAASLGQDVRSLKLYDAAGKLDNHAPLLDAIRMHLTTEQSAGRRVLGKALLAHFAAPPYGWDPNAVRVGVAALVRGGAVRVIIGKKPHTDPADRDLADALRVSRSFDQAELAIEETDVDPVALTETRTFLMKLARTRRIDETPAALSQVAGDLATTIDTRAKTVEVWASGSRMPLPPAFTLGAEAWRKVAALTNPIHRVRAVHEGQNELESGAGAVDRIAQFHTVSASLYTTMTVVASDMTGVRHLVASDGAVARFVDDFATATKTATAADAEVWKRLQSGKAHAALELDPMLDGWRKQARTTLDGGIDGIPALVAERGLPEELTEELGRPLVALRDSLDEIDLPVQVAALPVRAEMVVEALRAAIGREVEKRTPPPTDSPEPPKARVRTVRGADFGASRVHTEDEWAVVREQLDQYVRRLLRDGYEVELP